MVHLLVILRVVGTSGKETPYPQLYLLFFRSLVLNDRCNCKQKRLEQCKNSRTSSVVSHLMYADDVVIYCKADEREATNLCSLLRLYCQATGQQINWTKSVVHFSENTNRNLRRRLCNMMGMKECDHKGKCLGLPFCNFRSKNIAFGEVVEKLGNKLSGWKSKALSMAG